MAFVRTGRGWTVRNTATGKFGRIPGRQYGVSGGGAVVPFARDPKVYTTNAPTIVAALQRATSRVASYLALRTHQLLISTTPVDTGYARACWIISVGSRTSLTGGTPGSPDFAAQDASVAALASGGYSVRQGPIYVVNNAAYIMVLNAGHSQKAPVGFIEDAVQGAQQDANALVASGSL